MHSSQRVCCSLTFQTVLDTFYIRSPQDHHCFRDFLKRFRQHNVFLVAKIKCNNTVRIQNCDQLQWHNRDTEISCTTMGYEEEKDRVWRNLYVCFLMLSHPWQGTESTLFT